MNKKELNHLLALAKKAILALYYFNSHDFNIIGYNTALEFGYTWFTVEVENQFDSNDITRFKVKVEQDKVTYLYITD